ncbi:Triosephosphate isomerase [Pseudocohnilembus persalinus]|uniref:Triosephosphate isomerase n=1 Tax=Pseudocohnilembus persalinus TaxID=266149 RepID=A0A0V0QG08_PSEPJ|nr:Triosephosphate isomerase [Pseudocohnilembus persalinus]|eukprot:KRX01127.1 Triosephosphate isomerase [Pseudocohnilembus persalinus]
MQSARRNFVGGNWKSNQTASSVNDLVENILNKVEFDTNKVDVIVSPVNIHIPLVQSKLNKNIQVAAQNASSTGMGAFTGEVNAEQLVDLGLKWVIIGHSERRALYGETNEVVGGKVKTCLSKGLNVIACVGEKLEEREAGKTIEVVTAQLNAIAAKLTQQEWANVVVAYEPVWAIGTGKVATPEQAQEVHQQIRQQLNKISEQVGQQTRIIYGGSVNGKNCQELIGQADIDGFLVGGASLKPEFADIIKAAN